MKDIHSSSNLDIIDMKTESQAIIDVLSDVLSVSKMGSSVICEPVLPAPWGMKFEPAAKAMFHLIRRGTCLLQTNTMDQPLRLMQGDVVLITKCNGHKLTDSKDSSVEPFRDVLARHKGTPLEDSPHDITSMLCGVYFFQNYEYNPILALLPEVIHIPAGEVQNNMQLQALIQLILLESSRSEVGSGTAVSRFIDVMFIYIVRTWLQQQPQGTAGWLGALNDPRIGLAIGLIHKNPSHKWTVASLASHVNMSRSSFAQKFNSLVGETPLSYLTKWRMDLSSKLLTESDQKLMTVAAAVGYDSETSFSKTFKKFKSLPPGEYRTQYRKIVLEGN
ncbi:MAG: AraC family transcriptional regulator [Bacteroidetes bacterium]|nr:AraC family transcriptional regulator [Bacteroidota bacterium]